MKPDSDGLNALHRLLEQLGESTGVLKDLRAYLEGLEDRYLRLHRFVVWFVAVFGAGMVIALGSTAYQLVRAQKLVTKLEHQADRNTTAIRVGCVLLSNAIIRSGAATPKEGRRKPTSQGRLNGLLVPSCDDVAAHPERVKPEPGTQP